MLAVLALAADQLHPQADTERRPPALEPRSQGRLDPAGVQAFQPDGEGAHAGQHDALSRARHIGCLR